MPEQIFPTKEAEIRFFFVLTAALCLFFVTSFVLGSRVERGDVSTPSETASREFPPVVLQAKSAYVYDLRTGEIFYAKDKDKRLPLASLTKLMSALVASEISPSYATVTVGREALEATGDSGLMADEKWSLRDLLDFSLMTSSNDGFRAVALALGALEKASPTDEEIVESFVSAMNAKASELGLKNTYFWNETGLDESEVKGGAYGSAKDIATLLGHIIAHEPELMEATRAASTEIFSQERMAHLAKNTNSMVDEIPGLLASKTGFTDIAGGNLVFAFDPELGRPIVVAILGSTAEGRFEDARQLIKATLEYINGK